jgi:YD repeat-containing protein
VKTSGGHHHLVCAVIAVATLLVPLGHADAQFNHQITLKLPKGTNGIQPDLALVYVPGGGNGMVGMGWQLTGLSTITRANDGNGINYDGGDTYAHSQLGVLGGQPDGSYRSKKETFTKLVPSGTCGDGPCSWVAYDRSGLRFYFGTTADSRLLTHATGSVGTWGLAKVADLFGNSFEVEYTNDAANGVLYPSVITYTKGPGVTAYRTVEFAYEPRADVEPGYYQSAFQQTTARLKWIEVRSAGELLRKYRLDYGEYGAATGRSHLTAVQEYGSDGTSTLPAQNFVWQQGGQGFGFERWGTQQGGWVDGDDWPKESTFLTGDFDGDGRTDVACVFYDAGSISIDVHLATGGSFAWQRWSTKQGGWVGGDDWAKRSMFLTGDFDGDGKTDIAYVFNDGGLISMDVHRSTGSSFALERWATQEGGWINGDDWQKKSTFLQGDFDGDGKTDVAYVFNDGGLISMDVHRSTGSSFISERWATRQGGWINGDDWQKKSQFLQGDFNGDGKTDIAYIFNDGGLISMDVHRSTGSSFVWGRWATQQGGWVNEDDWEKKSIFLPGDFNGDGKTDVAYVFNDGGLISMDVHGSTGSSFSWERWATQQGGWVGGDDWQRNSIFLPGDFNGDGRTDLAYVFNDSGHISMDVHSSTGGSFSWERWATQQGGWIGGDDWQKKSTFLSGDFDGDGKADIAYVFNDGGGQSYDVHSSASPAPDLMTRVENGLGGTVTISYAPAPQVPNAIVPASAAPGIPNTSPQQLITRVTTTDGRGGTYSTQSNYYDARLYPGTIQDQRVLGFGYIETVDIQTGQLMRQYYDQHPGYEDHLAQEDAYTAAGQLISRKSHQYELVYPNPGTELAREIVLIAETYELGAPAFTQRTVRSYDAYGNATVVSQDADRLPNVTVNTTFSNDSANWILGRIAEVKTSSGGTTLGWMKNEWAGNVIAQKAEWLDTTNAWVATTMTYDTSGNIASVTEPPTGDGLVRTTTTEYDSTFKTYPTKVTNALGHAVQRSYNADGLIAAVIDVNGHSTAATYDVFGRKVGETRADGGTTSYSYMNYGDPWSQANWTRTTVGSQVLESAELFDGAGFKYRVSTSGDEGRTVCVDSAKDAAGRTAQVSLPHFCGEPARWTTTTYDIAGRPSTVSAPDGNVTTYAYATDHTSVKDPSGGVTAKYYDSRQKTTAVVDAAGQTTSFGNDALGRLNWVKLPDGSVTTTAYDSLNHKTSVADPHLGTTAYSYDAVGNMTSLTSAGKTIKYKYDALNRVARKQPVGEDAARYTYDEAATANGRGRLTSSVDAGGTTRFTYTSTGQLNSYAKRIDGSEYSQHFTYDTSGRLTQLTYPDGSYADYLYAGGRNLSSVSLNGTAYATWSNYNASGKPETVTYGNGVGTAYGS